MTAATSMQLAIAFPQSWWDYINEVDKQREQVDLSDRAYRIAAHVHAALHYHEDEFGVAISREQIDDALSTIDKCRGYHQPQPLCDIVRVRLFDAYRVNPAFERTGYVSNSDSWEFVLVDKSTKQEVKRTRSVEQVKELTGRTIEVPTIKPPLPLTPLPSLNPPDPKGTVTKEQLTMFWSEIEAARAVLEANKEWIPVNLRP